MERMTSRSSISLQEGGFRVSLLYFKKMVRCVYAADVLSMVHVCMSLQKLRLFINKATNLLKGDTFGLRWDQ